MRYTSEFSLPLRLLARPSEASVLYHPGGSGHHDSAWIFNERQTIDPTAIPHHTPHIVPPRLALSLRWCSVSAIYFGRSTILVSEPISNPQPWSTLGYVAARNSQSPPSKILSQRCAVESFAYAPKTILGGLLSFHSRKALHSLTIF